VQKIEAGEMEYRMDVLDVHSLVTEAINSNAGYASAHNVSIVQDCPDQDTPLLIEGDETRLMQVMANMISNAAKFSEEGGVVTVGCERKGDKIRIYVTDTGCGIPEGVEHKVFDRFSQLDSSDVRRAAGSGLGMNISREIVEHHKGIIDYASKLGVGTTFFAEFPTYQEQV